MRGCHVIGLPFLYRTSQVQGHTLAEDPYCLDCTRELVLARMHREGSVPESWKWALP